MKMGSGFGNEITDDIRTNIHPVQIVEVSDSEVRHPSVGTKYDMIAPAPPNAMTGEGN